MSPPGGSRAAPDAGTGTLALITTGIFGFFTSVSMIGPLLLDIARDLHVSLGRAGLLAAFMAVPWALGSPFAGFLSDRWGRRPMIVLALAGVGTMGIAAAGARDFATLAAVRFTAGVVGSCGPTSLMASVGDLFAPAHRARAMGWFNMGFSLAAVAGVPVIGAVGGLLGWRWAFALMGVALLLLAVAFRVAFPSPPPVRNGGDNVLVTYRAVFGVPRLLNVLGANLLERSMFGMMTLYFPAFLMLRHGLDAVRVAPALAVVAVGTIAGNVVGGWLGDRLPKLVIFIVCQLAAAAVGLVLFSVGLPFVAAMALAALFGLASATSRPGFLAFGSELAPRHRGALFGMIGLTNQGGLVVGSSIGGLAIELAGYAGFAILLAAQGMLAALLMLPLATRPARTAPYA